MSRVSEASPSDMISMPPTISGRGPMRVERRPAIGATAITMSVIGSVRTPDSSAE